MRSNFSYFVLLTIFLVSTFQGFSLDAQTRSGKNQAPSVEDVVPKHRISAIDVGGVFFTDIAADTVYTYLYKFGLMGGINIGYTYQNSVIQHKLYLNGGLGKLFSPYNNPTAYKAVSDLLFQGELSYSVAFPVFNRSLSLGRMIIFLGPATHFYLNAWIPNSEEVNLLRYAWNIHAGVGIYTGLDWSLNNRSKMTLGLYLPALGIGWRPQYSTYTLREEAILETQGTVVAIFSDPSFVSFHNLLHLNMKISFERELTKTLAATVAYLFNLEYVSIPRERLNVQNNLSLGLSIRL